MNPIKQKNTTLPFFIYKLFSVLWNAIKTLSHIKCYMSTLYTSNCMHTSATYLYI